mmetsp:Transcript_52560/g.87364  ORF Transcript_52560/g.87364 Transcript_52560/m.87364 type:complete len:207 (+) Transcript_52560:76-696(+)
MQSLETEPVLSEPTRNANEVKALVTLAVNRGTDISEFEKQSVNLGRITIKRNDQLVSKRPQVIELLKELKITGDVSNFKYLAFSVTDGNGLANLQSHEPVRNEESPAHDIIIRNMGIPRLYITVPPYTWNWKNVLGVLRTLDGGSGFESFPRTSLGRGDKEPVRVGYNPAGFCGLGSHDELEAKSLAKRKRMSFSEDYKQVAERGS